MEPCPQKHQPSMPACWAESTASEDVGLKAQFVSSVSGDMWPHHSDFTFSLIENPAVRHSIAPPPALTVLPTDEDALEAFLFFSVLNHSKEEEVEKQGPKVFDSGPSVDGDRWSRRPQSDTVQRMMASGGGHQSRLWGPLQGPFVRRVAWSCSARSDKEAQINRFFNLSFTKPHSGKSKASLH